MSVDSVNVGARHTHWSLVTEKRRWVVMMVFHQPLFYTFYDSWDANSCPTFFPTGTYIIRALFPFSGCKLHHFPFFYRKKYIVFREGILAPIFLGIFIEKRDILIHLEGFFSKKRKMFLHALLELELQL